MRTIPAALATHIAGEVISLPKCLMIKKADGSVLRLTTHDRDIISAGDTYKAGVSLDTTALQMTDNLSVDNSEVTIGIDGTIVTKDMFAGDLFTEAEFLLFLVNWQSPSDGRIILKRGWVGDITVKGSVSAKLQLRGLTQALQKSIVAKYSPTCRVNLGGKKCGVVNTPLRVRRDRQKVRALDWFLIPNANITGCTITNSGFETNGSVANGPSGISNWTYGSGSYWKTNNAFTPGAGSWYLEGGDDGGGSGTGAEFTLFQTQTTTALGFNNTNVDTGNYTFDFQSLIAGTANGVANPGQVFVEQLDAAGNTIQLTESDWIVPDYQSWQGIGVTTFVMPGCRSIKVGFRARKDIGSSASVAFDVGQARFWTNVIGSFGAAVFRVKSLGAATGHLGSSAPAPSYTLDATSSDGDATIQAKPLVFGLAAVTGLGDQRTFAASAIPTFAVGSVMVSAVISFAGVAANGDSVSVSDGYNSEVFTYNVNVQTGSTATDSCANLAAALLASGLNMTIVNNGTSISLTNLNNFGGSISKVGANITVTPTNTTLTPAAAFYSGKIVWFSGNNAGRISFVRIWNDGTKTVKLYDELTKTIQIGDKFSYGLGCDKTINTCGTVFFNAMNFRGEPYLPGPTKVIDFLTTATQ